MILFLFYVYKECPVSSVNLQIFPSAEVLQAGEVMWGGSAAKTIKIRNMNKASLPVRLSIWSVSTGVVTHLICDWSARGEPGLMR